MSSNLFLDYGNDEVKMVYEHFEKTLVNKVPDLSSMSLTNEWNLLKKLVTRKFDDMTTLSWNTVFKETEDLGHIMLLIDLMLTIPSTSVTCETAFSQLLKTCRRSRIGTSLLNSLMTVKLESPPIAEFNPETAIDTWLADSLMDRRPTYKRRSKTRVPESAASQEVIVLPNNSEDSVTVISQSEPMTLTPHNNDESDAEDSASDIDEQQTVSELSYVSFEREVDILCDKDVDPDQDDECFDYQDELFNLSKLMEYNRE